MVLNRLVTIDYTNYRGERRMRRILPAKIWFGSNRYHGRPQWFLDAFDVEKQGERSFAMKDIHGWT